MNKNKSLVLIGLRIKEKKFDRQKLSDIVEGKNEIIKYYCNCDASAQFIGKKITEIVEIDCEYIDFPEYQKIKLPTKDEIEYICAEIRKYIPDMNRRDFGVYLLNLVC